MNVQKVCLDYGTDAACVSYAGALAALLRAELIVGYAPQEGGRMTGLEARITRIRISHEVSEELVNPNAHLTVQVVLQGSIEWPETEAIIVSNHLQQHVRLPVWRPAAERSVRDVKAPVLIPFGNKPELELGYLWGVELARRIGVSAIFYHTTWPKDRVTSLRGVDHWHAGAEEVARRAETYAREQGVPSETIVEQAASVREGIHQMALYRCVSCIVAQQDANVISGGYHDELIRYGHLVPLVILPKRSA